MDPYMQSGYRNDRARAQAQAFKRGDPSGGFLAPGFPVEVAKPPVPPPPILIVPAAAAGAGGGSLAFPLGAVFGAGIGAWYGNEALKEIERFKKSAVSVPYNTEGPFYPGKGWKQAYDESKYIGKDVPWTEQDEMERDLYRDHLYDLLKNFSFPEGVGVGSYQYMIDPVPGLPPTFYAADGLHGPIYRAGNTYYFHTLHSICTGGPRDRWKTIDGIDITGGPGTGCAGQPMVNWGNSGWSDAPACVATVGRTGSATPLWVCPSNPNVMATSLESGSNVGTNSTRLAERFDINSMSALGQSTPQGLVVAEGTGTIVRPGSFAEAEAEFKIDPWDNGGWEPSLAEQLADRKLPGGKLHKGYYISVPINYPFTVIHLQPGSPPVTVPDVIIDPGTPTQPGTVTVVPPSTPPDFPAPPSGKFREQKPRLQKFIHAGFVAINWVTETNDLLTALHKGLPKKLRRKGPRGAAPAPWVILEDIWDHWDQYDSQKGLEAFVNNQIEDAIYGRFFGVVSRTQKRLGVSQGLSRGIRGRQPWKLPVPEVHFANGAHSISVGDVEIDVTFGHQKEK